MSRTILTLVVVSLVALSFAPRVAAFGAGEFLLANQRQVTDAMIASQVTFPLTHISKTRLSGMVSLNSIHSEAPGSSASDLCR
jgi:hypothetical protein